MSTVSKAEMTMIKQWYTNIGRRLSHGERAADPCGRSSPRTRRYRAPLRTCNQSQSIYNNLSLLFMQGDTHTARAAELPRT